MTIDASAAFLRDLRLVSTPCPLPRRYRIVPAKPGLDRRKRGPEDDDGPQDLPFIRRRRDYRQAPMQCPNFYDWQH